MLLASFPFPAARSDRCLGSYGAALLDTVMKYVVNLRVSVVASARPACSMDRVRAICCLYFGNWMPWSVVDVFRPRLHQR